jgi:hemerythrin-like domain-containing protein
MAESTIDRRRFLRMSGVAGGALLVPAAATVQERDGGRGAPHEKEGEEDEVAPPEDLMREHGVLKRVLLVYEEAIRRIDARQDLPPDAVRNGAAIIRTYIEDYHEKLEEDYLFPRFEQARRLAHLTQILRAQHQAGRRVTDDITRLATAQTLKDQHAAGTLRDAMHQFVRMYGPHEAHEDTVLFPALLFGEDGFEKMVDRVAVIEKSLGIYDLAQFTPK